MSKEVFAKDKKCCMCDKQAVAFWPVIDPDIPSYPYCADHLEEAMIDMAKEVWKDDKGMQRWRFPAVGAVRGGAALLCCVESV